MWELGASIFIRGMFRGHIITFFALGRLVEEGRSCSGLPYDGNVSTVIYRDVNVDI